MRELKLYDNELTEVEGLQRCVLTTNWMRPCTPTVDRKRDFESASESAVQSRVINHSYADNETYDCTLLHRVCSCKKLEKLLLQNNKIGPRLHPGLGLTGAATFTPLADLKLLRVLRLDNNSISSVEGAFEKCFSLVELDLSGNELVSLKGIGTRALKNLEVLRLSRNRLAAGWPSVATPAESAQGKTTGPGATRKPPSNTPISFLSELSADYLPSLQDLYLDGNGLGSISGGGGAGVISSGSTTVTSLSFLSNFSTSTNFTTLDLSSNGITTALFASIPKLPSLTVLNLAHNGIDALPAGAVLAAQLPALDVLDLSNNTLALPPSSSSTAAASSSSLSAASNPRPEARIAILFQPLTVLQQLAELCIDGNPLLLTAYSNGTASVSASAIKEAIVALLPSLETLDGVAVHPASQQEGGDDAADDDDGDAAANGSSGPGVAATGGGTSAGRPSTPDRSSLLRAQQQQTQQQQQQGQQQQCPGTAGGGSGGRPSTSALRNNSPHHPHTTAGHVHGGGPLQLGGIPLAPGVVPNLMIGRRPGSAAARGTGNTGVVVAGAGAAVVRPSTAQAGNALLHLSSPSNAAGSSLGANAISSGSAAEGNNSTSSSRFLLKSILLPDEIEKQTEHARSLLAKMRADVASRIGALEEGAAMRYRASEAAQLQQQQVAKSHNLGDFAGAGARAGTGRGSNAAVLAGGLDFLGTGFTPSRSTSGDVDNDDGFVGGRSSSAYDDDSNGDNLMFELQQLRSGRSASSGSATAAPATTVGGAGAAPRALRQALQFGRGASDAYSDAGAGLLSGTGGNFSASTGASAGANAGVSAPGANVATGTNINRYLAAAKVKLGAGSGTSSSNAIDTDSIGSLNSGAAAADRGTRIEPSESAALPFGAGSRIGASRASDERKSTSGDHDDAPTATASGHVDGFSGRGNGGAVSYVDEEDQDDENGYEAKEDDADEYYSTGATAAAAAGYRAGVAAVAGGRYRAVAPEAVRKLASTATGTAAAPASASIATSKTVGHHSVTDPDTGQGAITAAGSATARSSGVGGALAGGAAPRFNLSLLKQQHQHAQRPTSSGSLSNSSSSGLTAAEASGSQLLALAAAPEVANAALTAAIHDQVPAQATPKAASAAVAAGVSGSEHGRVSTSMRGLGSGSGRGTSAAPAAAPASASAAPAAAAASMNGAVPVAVASGSGSKGAVVRHLHGGGQYQAAAAAASASRPSRSAATVKHQL